MFPGLYETVDIVSSQLYTLFKTSLELSVTNFSFIFNGKLFRQIEAVGMGVLLSPIFANIFISFMEKKWSNEMILNLCIADNYAHVNHF